MTGTSGIVELVIGLVSIAPLMFLVVQNSRQALAQSEQRLSHTLHSLQISVWNWAIEPNTVRFSHPLDSSLKPWKGSRRSSTRRSRACSEGDSYFSTTGTEHSLQPTIHQAAD